ncbi:uncharacterized protein LOC123037335 [Drosophila rhopaloa]|uniref:Uncharacterized protein n=1 Tax=Drosophila rhopaloa TaxID=1041015 RepID=A0ABM5J3J4_DRORH|nr:uncharacterized protein LOC123037335 [Drosophila rhopaloa]
MATRRNHWEHWGSVPGEIRMQFQTVPCAGSTLTKYCLCFLLRSFNLCCLFHAFHVAVAYHRRSQAKRLPEVNSKIGLLLQTPCGLRTGISGQARPTPRPAPCNLCPAGWQARSRVQQTSQLLGQDSDFGQNRRRSVAGSAIPAARSERIPGLGPQVIHLQPIRILLRLRKDGLVHSGFFAGTKARLLPVRGESLSSEVAFDFDALAPQLVHRERPAAAPAAGVRASSHARFGDLGTGPSVRHATGTTDPPCYAGLGPSSQVPEHLCPRALVLPLQELRKTKSSTELRSSSPSKNTPHRTIRTFWLPKSCPTLAYICGSWRQSTARRSSMCWLCVPAAFRQASRVHDWCAVFHLRQLVHRRANPFEVHLRGGSWSILVSVLSVSRRWACGVLDNPIEMRGTPPPAAPSSSKYHVASSSPAKGTFDRRS